MTYKVYQDTYELNAYDFHEKTLPVRPNAADVSAALDRHHERTCLYGPFDFAGEFSNEADAREKIRSFDLSARIIHNAVPFWQVDVVTLQTIDDDGEIYDEEIFLPDMATIKITGALGIFADVALDIYSAMGKNSDDVEQDIDNGYLTVDYMLDQRVLCYEDGADKWIVDIYGNPVEIPED